MRLSVSGIKNQDKSRIGKTWQEKSNIDKLRSSPIRTLFKYTEATFRRNGYRLLDRCLLGAGLGMEEPEAALTFEEHVIQENHERVLGELLQEVHNLPIRLLLHEVIYLPPSCIRVREIDRKSESPVQLPDVAQKVLLWLQLLVQEQGVAYFQFKFGAGQVKGVDEALEAPMDVSFWGLREVEAEAFQDLSWSVSLRPQREQGQGAGDAHRGEEDVS